MSSRRYLGVVDYIVLAASLLICALIGVLFRFTGGKQKTTSEYLLAGKAMSALPVILSMTATTMSATSMMGVPAEVYRYGIQYVIVVVAAAFGVILASYLFIPIYFRCGVSTSYEFLEIRYGKYTKNVVAGLFVVQTALAMSAVLYGPALSLSAVTSIDINSSILIIGGICTFYCVLGGLKAVMWTDSFQMIFMFTCLIAFYAAGIIDGGGIANIYERAWEGDRLQFFKFNFDLVTRYTFWNTLLQGFISGLSIYGTSQLEIQRVLSIRDKDKSIATLQISTISMFIMHVMCAFAGLILYSVYYSCDPVLDNKNTGLTRYDQVVPYYIVNRFSSIPGLTGLCISGIFCGSLSTISSAVNSLSTVTVVNFVQAFFPHITEKRTVFLAKFFTLLYGLSIIALAYAFMHVQSIKQLVNVLWSTLEGPSTAIFLMGALQQKGSDMCALFGLVVGIICMAWIGYGSLISGYSEAPLHLSTSHCANMNATLQCLEYGNCTLPKVSSHLSDTFVLYKISFLWLPVLGILITLVAMYIAILVTGWNNNVIASDSKCLSPVTKLWIKQSENTNTEMKFSRVSGIGISNNSKG